MSYKATLQDVTSRDYLIEYPLATSSGVEKADISEILDSLFFVWVRRNLLNGPLFYRNLSPLLEIDLSSVQPYFEIKSETSLMGEAIEEVVPEEILEYDIVVRIPPRKRYTIELKVNSVRRAEPRIVEPEGF